MDKYKFVTLYPDQNIVLTRGSKKITIKYAGITQLVDFFGWYSEDGMISEHCQEDFNDLNIKRKELRARVKKVYNNLLEDKEVV